MDGCLQATCSRPVAGKRVCKACENDANWRQKKLRKPEPLLGVYLPRLRWCVSSTTSTATGSSGAACLSPYQSRTASEPRSSVTAERQQDSLKLPSIRATADGGSPALLGQVAPSRLPDGRNGQVLVWPGSR